MPFWYHIVPVFLLIGLCFGSELDAPIAKGNILGMFNPRHVESNVIDALRDKCYNTSNLKPINAKTVKVQDDPNMKQSMMAHAFIDSLNEAFKNDNGDQSNPVKKKIDRNLLNNFTFVNTNPKVAPIKDLSIKYLTRRMANNGFQFENCSHAILDKDNVKTNIIKRDRTRISWVKDNFSYNLNLPAQAMKQDTIQSIINAISSAVEEEVAIIERSNNERKLQGNYLQEYSKPVVPQLYYTNQYPLNDGQFLQRDIDNERKYPNPKHHENFFNGSYARRVGSEMPKDLPQEYAKKSRASSVYFGENNSKTMKDRDALGEPASLAGDKEFEADVSNNERLTDTSYRAQKVDNLTVNNQADKYPPPVWTVGKSFADQTVQDLFKMTQKTGCSEKKEDNDLENVKDSEINLKDDKKLNFLSDDSMLKSPATVSQSVPHTNALNQLESIEIVPSRDEVSQYNSREGIAHFNSEDGSSHFNYGSSLGNSSAEPSSHDNLLAIPLNDNSEYLIKEDTPSLDGVNTNNWSDLKQFEFDVIPPNNQDHKAKLSSRYNTRSDVRKRKSESSKTPPVEVTEEQYLKPGVLANGDQSSGFSQQPSNLSETLNSYQEFESTLDESKPGIELGLSKSSPVIRISIPIDLEMIKDTLQSYYQYKDLLDDSERRAKFRRELDGSKKPFVRKFALPTSVVFTKRNIQMGRNRRGITKPGEFLKENRDKQSLIANVSLDATRGLNAPALTTAATM